MALSKEITSKLLVTGFIITNSTWQELILAPVIEAPHSHFTQEQNAHTFKHECMRL